MNNWEPNNYSADPVANALLNIAAEMSRMASATSSLYYAMKYSKDEGLSIAESIEEAGKNIAHQISTAIDHQK